MVRRAVRTYPYGSAAAHIRGYVGQINETELKDKVAEVYAIGDCDSPAVIPDATKAGWNLGNAL